MVFTPKLLVGVNGKMDASEVEPILPLKVDQSPEERYPFCAALACVMVSAPVEEFHDSGAVAEMEVEARRPREVVAVKV